MKEKGIKVVRDAEKSSTYAYSKTKGAFRYGESILWTDGEKTQLTKEKMTDGSTIYRTEGRYPIGSDMPDLTAKSIDELKIKVAKREAELAQSNSGGWHVEGHKWVKD